MSDESTAAVASETGKQPREMSSVQFPYADLEEGLSVARVIHQQGGHPMSREQLAAVFKQKVTSGAFVTKVSAGRMFGFLELTAAGRLQISALGYEALDTDESRARGAKARAFLNVELYRKLYDQYRTTQLPPRPLGLEQAMVGFGVAAKQKTNARYAFDRSAKQAGFFDHGSDRLVEPVIGPATSPPDERASNGNGVVDPMPKPPERRLNGVIAALIDELPPSGAKFDGKSRGRWLTMMKMAFELAYGPEPASPTAEETGEISGFRPSKRPPFSGPEGDDEIPF